MVSCKKFGAAPWPVRFPKKARLFQSLLCSASLLVLYQPALAGGALPTAGSFTAGHGSIAAAANGLTINQSSSHGIIDWRSFSIGAGNTVQFNNGAGATLNRVTGGNLSRIDGNLRGTGSVYLINPQGIVIGPGGKVVTNGSFVASTRDIPNSQFMAGGSMTASGASNGDVVNAGTITSKTGDAILVGRSVTNKGTINAPKGQAALAAGNEIILQTSGTGPHIAVSGGKGDATNTGTVKAAQAALASAGGNIYALVQNNGGLISAAGTKTINGHVWLSAGGSTTVSGTITARNADGSGGAVTVRGQDIGLSGSIDASATAAKTNGGDVSVIAKDRTTFSGAIKAQGGTGGTGGTVETSGDVLDVHGATVDTTAPNGTTGDWLLDPYNVTISDGTTATAPWTALRPPTPSRPRAMIHDQRIRPRNRARHLECHGDDGRQRQRRQPDRRYHGRRPAELVEFQHADVGRLSLDLHQQGDHGLRRRRRGAENQ